MTRRILTAAVFVILGLNSACQQLNQGWRPTEQPVQTPGASMKVLSDEVLTVPSKVSRLTLSGNQSWTEDEMSAESLGKCFLRFPESAIDRRIQPRTFVITQESIQPFAPIWKEVLSDLLSLTPWASRTAGEMVAIVEASSTFQEAKEALKTRFDIVFEKTPEVRQIFSVSEADGKKLTLKLVCDLKATMSLPELEQHLSKSKSILAPVQNF